MFDPRIAIIKLPEYINVGYGPVKNVSITYNEVTNEDGSISKNAGSVSSFFFTPNLPTDENITGGVQEFLSWLYADFTVVANLTDPLDGGKRVDIIERTVPTPVKQIDAKYYDYLINQAAVNFQDDFGFATRRYIGTFQPIIPLKWTFLRYGPFTKFASESSTGPIQMMEDTGLTPWNFGNIARMTQAGTEIANFTGSNVTTINFANITVEGFPEFGLGATIGINSNVTDISVDFGTNGVVTNYKLKTFFGPVPLQKKGDFDKGNKSRSKLSNVKKDMIKVDEILKEINKKHPSTPMQRYTNGGSPQPDNRQFKNKNNKNVVVSTKSGGKVQTKLTSVGEIKDVVKTEGGPYADVHYADINELFYPFTTNTTKGDVPRFRGQQ
jgi:hypothetical protein